MVDKIPGKMYRTCVSLMRKNIIIAGLTLSLFLLASGKSVFAADDCTIIYGGGEIKCQATQNANKTITATSTQPVTTPTTGSASNAANAGQTTKGGLPVYSPTPATETPGTGPEAFGLISLIPAAAAGLYLRKKTK